MFSGITKKSENSLNYWPVVAVYIILMNILGCETYRTSTYFMFKLWKFICFNLFQNSSISVVDFCQVEDFHYVHYKLGSYNMSLVHLNLKLYAKFSSCKRSWNVHGFFKLIINHPPLC